MSNISNLISFFSIRKKDNIYNFYALAIAAGFGHVFFGLYWRYVNPQSYELPILRLVGLLICVILFFVAKNYNKLSNYKNLVQLWWFFSVLFNLPFFFTVSLIASSFHPIWLTGEATMIFVVIMFFSGILVPFLSIILGVICAMLFCKYFGYGSLFLHPLLIEVIPIYLLTIISAYIFSISNVLGFSVVQEAQFAIAKRSLKSLAGSIAHELRNPLNAINLIGAQIKETLSNDFNDSAREKLNLLTSQITKMISEANGIINIILSDLSEKSINPKEFSYLKPSIILPVIIENYGYKSQSEKNRVNFIGNKDNDFVFNTIPNRFTFIMYNLIKNALYYLSEFPNSKITIGTEQRLIQHKMWNVIYVYDSGPGIPQDALSKLFDDFFTSGKKDGTGLGLAFCKRTMLAFGGDIICESKFGDGKQGWTKFSLLFPKLSEEELKVAQQQNDNTMDSIKKAKILIVDDQETNLIITKQKISMALPSFACNTALSGKEAVRILKSDTENEYQLVLLDIQMPHLSGIETMKEIRKFNQEIPIVALTSLNHREFVEACDNDQTVIDSFNLYLNKSVPSNIIFRSITKLTAQEDNLQYLGNEENYSQYLQNKSILLADDQEMNLLITKKRLEKYGITVDTVTDGTELVQHYKESLDEQGKSKYDMIITDINMPLLNGDDATKEIRQIEKQNNIYYRNMIPIIALSGDGDKEDTDHFLQYKMTDYFIKGSDPENLMKVIANYLVTLNEHQYGSDFNRLIDKTENAVKEEQTNNAKIKDDGEKQENLSKNTVLNIELLNHISDNDANYKKTILDSFLKDSAEVCKRIKNNLNQLNTHNLYLEVHALKGISSNLGSEKLFQCSAKACEELKNGNEPDNSLYDKLFFLYEELVIEVRNEMNLMQKTTIKPQ